MLELKQDSLKFTFPEVHPDAELTITFIRTLRIPDDDKTYPLPPGLGFFPLQHVDDYRERVPAKWMERGGVMLPMFQAEALWIKFESKYIPKNGTRYPFAVKIGTGKVSAITGDEWEKGLKQEDYVVVPQQPWIDGYKVEEDVIRQFVAAPLGAGFSAEEQITGKAVHGGIQIEVLPMHRSIFDKKFPERNFRATCGVTRGSGSLYSSGDGGLFGGSMSKGQVHVNSIGGIVHTNGTADVNLNGTIDTVCSTANVGERIDLPPNTRSFKPKQAPTINADMGLSPGGKMTQQIFDDPHGKDCWRQEDKARCFVHLANSLAWEAITQKKPPATPVTASTYANHNYPWFEYYDESQTPMKATEKLQGLKSVMELGFQKGFHILPENETVNPSDKVQIIKGKAGQIRVGAW